MTAYRTIVKTISPVYGGHALARPEGMGALFVRWALRGGCFGAPRREEAGLRDVRSLSDRYDLALLEMHDFFPNTHHVEALAVLKSR